MKNTKKAISELSFIECNVVAGAATCTCYKGISQLYKSANINNSDDEDSQMLSCRAWCCYTPPMGMEYSNAVYVGKSNSVRMPCQNLNIYPLSYHTTAHDLSMFANIPLYYTQHK